MKNRIQEKLDGFTVAEIIAALGCPPPTAYQWKDGRRSPPEWQHPHWLAILNASKAAAKSKERKRQDDNRGVPPAKSSGAMKKVGNVSSKGRNGKGMAK